MTKAIGEGVTKTRRELAASAMGEAIPEAVVPAAGNRAMPGMAKTAVLECISGHILREA